MSRVVDGYTRASLEDHIFALVVTGVVASIGFGVILVYARLRRMDVVSYFIPKAVGTSFLILLPVLLFLSELASV